METLAAMRDFRHVVDAGGFAAAARQLGRATSSVSRQVAELEATLGVTLLNRTTRAISLTEAGETYYRHAVAILDDVAAARHAISDAAGKPAGTLRVTVPTAIGRAVIANTFATFVDAYPGTNIVLTATDSLVDLYEQRIDVAVRIGRLRDSALVAAKVAESRRICVASPTYLARHGNPRHPDDLRDFNCLTYRDHPGSNTWSFRGPDGLIKVAASGNMFILSADALAAAATAGIGLVVLPDWCVADEVCTGHLQTVLPNYQLVPDASPVYAIYPPTRHLAPKVRAFIDHLRQSLPASGKI